MLAGPADVSQSVESAAATDLARLRAEDVNCAERSHRAGDARKPRGRQGLEEDDEINMRALAGKMVLALERMGRE
jgi:hypothetical protein